MACPITLRTKLCSLLDNHKKLNHESNLIEEELTRCRAEKIKAEDTRTTKYAELMVREGKLEELTEKISETELKIVELEKSSFECRRTTEIIIAKIKTQDETIENLQNQAEEARAQAIDSAQVYTQALNQLRELQNSGEQFEKQEEHLKSVLLELELEKTAVNNSLRKSEFKNSQISQRLEKLEQTMQSFDERLKSANKRTAEAEDVYESLSLELAMLDEEANDWAQKSQNLLQHMDELKTSMQSA